MIFKSITIEGFRSIRNLHLDFKEKGLTLITGKNGIGKSTLFEALYFSLFGTVIKNTTLTEIKTLKEYRAKDYKGVFITLVFQKQDDYKIERAVDYGKSSESFLKVYKNDVLIPFTNKADSQSILNDIIGFSENTFTQSVFFAQKSLRLVDKKDADKKELFDELFEIDLETYLNKARTEVEAINQKIVDKKQKQQELSTKISTYQQQYDTAKVFLETFDSNKSRELAVIDAKIAEIQTLIKTLPTDLPELVPPDPIDPSEYSEQKILCSNLSFRIQHAKKELETTPISELCNTCGQKLSEDKIKELHQKRNDAIIEINSRISELELQLSKEQLKLNDCETRKNKYDKEYNDYNTLQLSNQQSLYNLKTTQQSLDSQLNMRKLVSEQKCQVTQEALDKLLETITTLQTSLNPIAIEIDTVEKELSLYKYWADTGFTNKGLKAYLLQALLGKLNTSLQKYGQKLGINIYIDLNLQSARKSFSIKITTNGVEKSYGALSGGEQKRVDIITSFAIHDMVADNVSLMVVDEFFEGLDEEGLDISMSLLRDKAQNRCVYLITHNINIDISMSDILKISKIDDFTCISN